MKLTAGQRRVLAATPERYEQRSPAWVIAEGAWPDSPGWQRTDKALGRVGVGLKMNAGRVLHRLVSMGLVGARVSEHHMYYYWQSDAGQRALRG